MPYSIQVCLLFVMALSIIISQENVRIRTTVRIPGFGHNHQNVTVIQQGRSISHLEMYILVNQAEFQLHSNHNGTLLNVPGFFTKTKIQNLQLSGLALPVISYFVTVGQEGDDKATKHSGAWRGSEYCLVCEANGPCSIHEEVCNVT